MKNVVPKRFGLAMRGALRSVVYWGREVDCPCCGGQFRKFLPYGPKRWPNRQCPRCSCLPRHRLAWLFLREETNLFTDSLRLLHIAPEFCYEKKFRVMANLDYVSADLDSPLAKVFMDITDIQEDDGSFDVIVCNHVLEHVLEDRQAMRELFRVLRPGGWALLQAPVDRNRTMTYEDPMVLMPEGRLRQFGQADHVRIYGTDYRSRLEEAGFQVEVIDYFEKIGAERRRKHGLLPTEAIYLCGKD